MHPLCRRPNDEFHFPDSNIPVRLDFPICSPSKASRVTLANSGSFLGLAPHQSLARLSSAPLLVQLQKKNTIQDNTWSVTLLDAESGILSLGATIAKEVEEAKIRGEIELKYFGDPVANPQWITKQVDNQLRILMLSELPWDHHFKWTKVQGAAGWWTALMSGVWINGAKVCTSFLPPLACMGKRLRPPLCCLGPQESARPLRHQRPIYPRTTCRSATIL